MILFQALSICNTVLDDVSKAAVHVVSKLCEYELRLAEQTTASQVATRIAEQVGETRGKGERESKR